jgi:hypothetical protein
MMCRTFGGQEDFEIRRQSRASIESSDDYGAAGMRGYDCRYKASMV